MKRKKCFRAALALCLAVFCTACQQDPIPPQQEPEAEPPQIESPTFLTDAEEALLAAAPMELPGVSAEQLTPAAVEPADPPNADGPVIFIADGGTGDGSSPDAPLAAVESGNAILTMGTENSRAGYFDSLLYQAAARLYGTGGTIVLVGPVTCTIADTIGEYEYRDLLLPYLGGAEITFTSVYDGVDYRETNHARLVMQGPACLNLNNPTVFRDMDLCTQSGSGFSSANRVICCNGFPTVVDTGVRCFPLNTDGTVNEMASHRDYPTIVGGNRYANLNRSTDLTIRSGTFHMVSGGCYGAQMAEYGHASGSTTLTIEGSAKILGAVSAASGDPMAHQDGDATLIIRGGEFSGPVQISGGGGFTTPNCTGTIRISGGTFTKGAEIKAAPRWAAEAPATSLLDCSAYSGSLPAVSGFTQVAWPGYGEVHVASQPHRTDYFSGDLLDLRGLSLDMIRNGEQQTLDYDGTIAGFRFCLPDGAEIDPAAYPLTEDDTAIAVYYTDIPAGEIQLTVTPRPAVAITGVSILADAERQSLGFLFGIEAWEDPAIAIKDCGILAAPAELVRSGLDLPQGKLAGCTKLACTALPADAVFTCSDTDGMLYAAVEDIPVEEYGRAYTAVAWYTFVLDGQLHTAYSQPCTTSVYAAAKQTGGAPQMVQLAENGGTSTRDEALVAEKVEAMLSYFESMANLTWTSPAFLDFAGALEWVPSLQYQEGETYRGIPYIAAPNGYANLENFTGWLDENGVYTGPTTWKAMYGNDCTSSVVQSMGRVSNQNDFYGGMGVPVANYAPLMDHTAGPIVKVGDYTFRPTDVLTTQVLRNNDRETIYEAYAAARRGDYLYAIWQHGTWLFPHIRLISRVDVVRRADGTIDPSSSYIRIHEQTSTLNPYTKTNWNLNYALSFSELANQSYLPTRDASFETGYFETPWCVVYDGNTRENLAQGLRGEVVSNYDLSEVELEIVDRQTGETVFEARNYTYFGQICSVTAMDPDGQIPALVGTGTYEYILRATAANTQRELIRFVF